MIRLLLLLNPVYVTLFWALVLNTNKAKGNAPKIFLGRFMFVAFLLYLSHVFYFLPIPGIYHYTDAFYQLFNMLLFPMYYIYIRLLTVDRSFSWKRHGIYFIAPSAMFLLYTAGVLAMSKEEHIHYLYDMLIDREKISGIFLYQKTVYTLCRVVFITQGFLYMFLSFRLVQTNRKMIQNYYANTDEERLDKIQWLNISLFLAIVSGIVLSVLGKESFLDNAESWLFAPFLVLSFLLFFLGWLGNKLHAIVIPEEENCKKENYGQRQDKNQAKNEQLLIIKQKLLHLFEKDKIYLDKSLTICDIANVIGTNRTYISSIINNDFEQNFSAFVNSYRARYAHVLLAQNPHIHKDDLAEMSGFGSVTSMQRAFGLYPPTHFS